MSQIRLLRVCGRPYRDGGAARPQKAAGRHTIVSRAGELSPVQLSRVRSVTRRFIPTPWSWSAERPSPLGSWASSRRSAANRGCCSCSARRARQAETAGGRRRPRPGPRNTLPASQAARRSQTPKRRFPATESTFWSVIPLERGRCTALGVDPRQVYDSEGRRASPESSCHSLPAMSSATTRSRSMWSPSVPGGTIMSVSCKNAMTEVVAMSSTATPTLDLTTMRTEYRWQRCGGITRTSPTPAGRRNPFDRRLRANTQSTVPVDVAPRRGTRHRGLPSHSAVRRAVEPAVRPRRRRASPPHGRHTSRRRWKTAVSCLTPISSFLGGSVYAIDPKRTS